MKTDYPTRRKLFMHIFKQAVEHFYTFTSAYLDIYEF